MQMRSHSNIILAIVYLMITTVNSYIHRHDCLFIVQRFMVESCRNNVLLSDVWKQSIHVYIGNISPSTGCEEICDPIRTVEDTGCVSTTCQLSDMLMILVKLKITNSVCKLSPTNTNLKICDTCHNFSNDGGGLHIVPVRPSTNSIKYWHHWSLENKKKKY